MKRILLSVFRFLQKPTGPFPSFIRKMQWKIKGLKSMWIAAACKACPASVQFGDYHFLAGLENISIGENTAFGDELYMTAIYRATPNGTVPELTIGRNGQFGLYNNITCTKQITIGDNCLTGKWVTITDNSHGGTTVDDLRIAPTSRPITSKGAVVIGDNVWIGDKATILPGVTIGDGVVIGANSVVTKDIPSYCVACGNPARIVKQLI